MKNGSKPSTIKDIARRANTSHATVSRVLNNPAYPVSNEMKSRVLEAARELDYTPNLIGRYLKTRNIADIGLMVPNISNPYYSNLVLGIEETLSLNGYNVLLCNSHRNAEKEEQILYNFMMKQVSGVIISSVSGSREVLKRVMNQNIQVVAVDQDLAGLPCSTVVFDYIKSGYIAVEHLINLRHRRIAYISSPLDRLSRINIFEGYRQALKSYNIPFDEYLTAISTHEEESANSNYEYTNGYNLMIKLLDMDVRPTAVFACNDMTAFGAMEAIKERQLRIPEDISLIGCDNILFSTTVRPALSTVDEPVYEMSRLAANLLLDKLKGNRQDISIVLQPKLIVRESTKPLE